MCGVTGGILFDQSKFDRQILQQMTTVMRHRGPDDSGIMIDGSVGLGFRRLAIIDLTDTGHQPMSVYNDSIWIVFNGEIYNFQHLKEELNADGVVFKGQSDTEVILHLYVKYGVNCFNRLRGMFGIAIWDKNKQQLILGRDRLGKKPLYYYKDSKKLLFASELKSIRQHPEVALRIDTEALSEYFSYGFIGAPRTIYQSVAKLEPGSILTVDFAGNISHQTYWDCCPEKDPDVTSFEEAKQLVFDKVDESIRIRMRSDVPLGAFLSGGIDSTIVVARMAEHSASTVKTFTIGFRDKAFDESDYAAITARMYGTDHHVEMIDPNYAHLIERIVCNFDEPFGDSSALPTYVVSEMIGKYVTVALSGDGGDEVFGGYEIYQESLAQRKFDKVPTPIKNLAKLFDPVYPESLPGRNYLRRFALSSPYDRFIERYKLISDPERKKLTGSAFRDTSAFKKKYFDGLSERTAFLSSLRYNDLKHYLEGDIMVKVDRMTMLNSIESRAPLLDHELVELSFRLPPDFLINKDQKKHILKEAFRGFIPAELLSRPKKGFSVPLARWFRGDLRPYFEEIVFNSQVEQSGLVDLSYVRRIFDIHQSGKRDLSFHLWLILAFVIWYTKVHLAAKMVSA